MKRTLTDWWQSLGPRERDILGFGATFVIAVIVYLWLWEPPATGIRKLQAELPQLQAQGAAMRSMADEAARLRAAAGNAAPIASAERPAAVLRSLERAGLWSANGANGPAAPASTTAGPVQTLSVGGAVTTVATSTTTRTAPPQVTQDGDRVRVHFDDIDYGVWIAWLATTETALSAHAAHVTVSANAPRSPVGHVQTDVLLDWTPAAAQVHS